MIKTKLNDNKNIFKVIFPNIYINNNINHKKNNLSQFD